MARRTRSGAAPGAPKPKIVPPKTPVLRRRGVRWGVLVVAVLGIGWIVLALLGSAHRKDVIVAYDQALARAMRPFTQHQVATGPDSFIQVPQNFSQGTATAAQLRESAQTWQEDFTKAAADVRVLEEPEQLRDAEEVIAQALDLYGTLAGAYLQLADSKALEARSTGAAKQRASKLVTDWNAFIERARSNAQSLLARGEAMVDGLMAEWGAGTSSDPQPTLPGDIQIPDGGIGS